MLQKWSRGSMYPIIRSLERGYIGFGVWGPCTQQLGTWDLGNSNYSAVFG